MRPLVLRPPLFLIGLSSDFSGEVRVTSSKSNPVMKRRPGEVGLKFLTPTVLGLLNLLEQVDGLPVRQRHVGFLPGRPRAEDLAGALLLAEQVRGAHGRNLDGKQRFDGTADLVLRRAARNAEDHLVVLGDERSLFGDQRRLQDLQRICHQPSLSSISASASCATTRFLCRRMSYTLRPSTGSTSTRGRLRPASSMLRSRMPITTSVLSATASPASSASNSLVFGCASSILSTTFISPSRAFCASALASALRRVDAGRRYAYERGCGPKIVAPPLQIGERLEPARARPVPFCLNGFLPPPRTNARVLVALVPARRDASCASTWSNSTASLTRVSKAAGNVTLPTDWLLRLTTGVSISSSY